MIRLFFLNDYFKLEPEITDAILEYGEKRFINELIKEEIVKGMTLCDGWEKVQNKAFEFLEETEGITLGYLKRFFNIDSYIKLLLEEKVIELRYFIEDYSKNADDKTYLWVDGYLFEYDRERLREKVKEVLKEVKYKEIFKLLKELEKYSERSEEE